MLFEICMSYVGLPKWLSDKESTCNARAAGDVSSVPEQRRLPRRRKWQPTPVFLPGKSHGQRNLTGYSLWASKRVRHDLATKQQQRHLRMEGLTCFQVQ